MLCICNFVVSLVDLVNNRRVQLRRTFRHSGIRTHHLALYQFITSYKTIQPSRYQAPTGLSLSNPWTLSISTTFQQCFGPHPLSFVTRTADASRFFFLRNFFPFGFFKFFTSRTYTHVVVTHRPRPCAHITTTHTHIICAIR